MRWGFVFLLGTSQLDEEHKLKLVAEATLLYLEGKDRVDLVEETYQGVLYTKHEWRVIGGFSGQQFDAVIESEMDSGEVHLRFLVSEQTLKAGPAFSVN